MVSGRRSGRLYTEPDPGNSGLMRVMWENADQDKSIDVSRQINGGRMGGLLAARDGFGAGALDRLDRLAFDLAGGRLGQGGGYYDRAFASDGGPLLCGVAYAFQLIDAVPCNSRARRMDAIVTDRGLHEITEKQ